MVIRHVDLEDVFRAHQGAVFAYFLRLVGNRQDAEELTQETFARACSAALRFRGDSTARTWLFGIARRVLLEAARAGLFERRAELPDMPASQNDTDERLDIARALASLGVADREVLVIVDMLGFEPIEGARMVGVSPEAFRVRLHRARARLREAYGA
jgi:RNA polymerase sigma-70 factor, ECF subfamily